MRVKSFAARTDSLHRDSITANRRPSTTRGAQLARPGDEHSLPQLGLLGIIAVWAAAAIPMGLLAWVAAPQLADHLSGPGALSRALLITLTAGLVWQFVLVLGLVWREQERCAGLSCETRCGCVRRVVRAPGGAEAAPGSSSSP